MCLTTEEGRRYAALRAAGVGPSEAFTRTLNGESFPVTPAELVDNGLVSDERESDTAEPISAAGEPSLGAVSG